MPADGGMEVEAPQEATPTVSVKRGGDDTPESAKQRRIGSLDVRSVSQVGRGG